MPDRFSELLDMAQRGRLTPEESEELATMLNAPVMPPAGHAVGFVSKHTFEPSDLKARIAAIRWFSKCGEPLALDLTMEVESARSWWTAIQACQSIAWQNVELEAQNQLTVWLHQNHRERYQGVWNDIVVRHKAEVISPLIKEKIIPFQLKYGLDVVLVHATSWDVLSALMENSYLDTHHPAHFFLELLWVYEAGHFPCGWLGDWPSGKLIVL